MVRHVVEVYRRCRLLHEINALDPHLGKLVLLLGQSGDAQGVLQLLRWIFLCDSVDAVALGLCRFIDLGGYNLV